MAVLNPPKFMGDVPEIEPENVWLERQLQPGIVGGAIDVYYLPAAGERPKIIVVTVHVQRAIECDQDAVFNFPAVDILNRSAGVDGQIAGNGAIRRGVVQNQRSALNPGDPV